MSTIDDALEAAIEKFRLQGRVAVALSGGLDSMVLLDTAARLTKHRQDIQLEALHVHHGLSPSADAWVEFCRHECTARKVPLAVEHVAVDCKKTNGQGVEAAARAVRYRAFVESGAQFVLSAQHADDQAETVLHQLLRGTGWAGLAGMGETRAISAHATLVRPFLNLERSVIEDFAQSAGLSWVEDESNADTAYTRNFLRHNVLPLLGERFAHYRVSLARAARHAAEADVLLEALAKLDLQWDGKIAHAGLLDNLPLERQANAIYYWLRWQGISPPSHAQLSEWARQLFRPVPTDKPHQAGGHGILILRKMGMLQMATP